MKIFVLFVLFVSFATITVTIHSPPPSASVLHPGHDQAHMSVVERLLQPKTVRGEKVSVYCIEKNQLVKRKTLMKGQNLHTHSHTSTQPTGVNAEEREQGRYRVLAQQHRPVEVKNYSRRVQHSTKAWHFFFVSCVFFFVFLVFYDDNDNPYPSERHCPGSGRNCS